ncbi:MAG: choice-of-anchor B family protein [Thiotrichaceae bacterium]
MHRILSIFIGLLSICFLASCTGGSSSTLLPETGSEPTACIDGQAAGFPCKAITLEKRVTLSTLGATAGNDIWGWTDSTNGVEYALMGLNNGTAFVRIDNPQNPVIVGTLPTQTVPSSWRDIKVYQNHAFIIADRSGAHGMQVFDLTRLRTNNTNVTFTPDKVYSEFTTAHNIVINEDSGCAYIVGTNTCGGGLHMVDIQDPVNPTFMGCHTADGDTHDAQCVNYIGPDTDYIGKEICFDSNESSVGIVDVSVKSNTISIASQDYPNLAFTHQAWLDETQRYLLVNDEFDEQNFGVRTRTMVLDVSDLDNPVYLYTHRGTTNAIDHNLYVVGKKIYEANYESGLRILEFTDLSTDTLSEVAFFDTYPESNEAKINGAWSVYPFFPSGTIVVSDINRGLFILTPE